MIEFSFTVKLSYRDAQAFIDEDLGRVHDRLNKRLFDVVVEEFTTSATMRKLRTDDRVIVETDVA